MFYGSTGYDTAAALRERSIGFGKILWTTTLAFLFLLGILYVLKLSEFYSRGWLLCWFVTNSAAQILIRGYFSRGLRGLYETGRLHNRIALFGDAEHVRKVEAHLAEHDPQVIVRSIHIQTDNGKVDQPSNISKLIEAMEEGVYDQVVIAIPEEKEEQIREAVRRLSPYKQEILLISNFVTTPLPRHGVRSVGRMRADAVSPVSSSELFHWQKRLFDLALTVPAVIALAPVLAFVALLIKLDSRGPVFFLQRRYGKNNRVFRIFKFRTMTVTEDGDVVTQAVKNDPRVTRIGRYLRATSIDELPQLLNVIKGDMSLVGPRPHAIAHETEFERSLDLFSRRRRVLPGITGWAQVNGYRGETRTLEDVRRRMEFDLDYVDRWSIGFDLEILARTVLTVLRGAH